MRSCERPLKRSASEALPPPVPIRSSLSPGPRGSSCRRRATSSLRRVSSFSASSSSSRAASHSLRVPVMCFVIALLSFLPGSSPQPFDLLGQDAGEVLPALLVAAAHLVVGEPVVRQYQIRGAAGRRHLDGHPGLEPARRFRHPRELQQPRALHAQIAAVVRPQTAGMVRLPIPKLVDRSLAENGPVRLAPSPKKVGFVPRDQYLILPTLDPTA